MIIVQGGDHSVFASRQQLGRRNQGHRIKYAHIKHGSDQSEQTSGKQVGDWNEQRTRAAADKHIDPRKVVRWLHTCAPILTRNGKRMQRRDHISQCCQHDEYMGQPEQKERQSFDGIGLPGFQFIQDEIEYDTRTHHSNQDVYDRLQAEDLKQSATIMAAFVYQSAMRDEKLPRKPTGPKTVESAKTVSTK